MLRLFCPFTATFLSLYCYSTAVFPHLTLQFLRKYCLGASLFLHLNCVDNQKMINFAI